MCNDMSKYKPLWEYLNAQSADSITMTFDDIAKITGFKFDHSFLTYKKELPNYGWCFEHLSLKEHWVKFVKI